MSASSESSKIGKVYLVGAGPGDPGLITLRGVECLQRADVVLFDGLANPRILANAPPSAQLVSVGKHGRTRSWKQSEIDEYIVTLARQGKVVVRLKGGDPAIFARTAEELDRLVRESIPFEVVPGITAALAASSYAGIPLTHRDWASCVAFITGQQQADGGTEAEEPLDWESLARFPGTLVVYMGVTTAQHWSRQLILAGKSPDTPVALIRRCTLPDQHVIHCQLRDVADHLMGVTALRPPVIAVVGNVTRLASTLDWFASRPLFGKTILVTRPEHQADTLARTLEELGAEVLIQPGVRIETLDDFCDLDRYLKQLSKWDWIVFSSQNGVHHFFSRLWDIGLDARALRNTQIAAVGPSTAESLISRNLRCDLQPVEDYSAESLATDLWPLVGNKNILLVRASRGRQTLHDQLCSTGASVDTVIAYSQVDVEQASPEIYSRMESRSIDYTIITSSASARSIVKMFGDSLRSSQIVSLSPITASTLSELGFPPQVTSRNSTTTGIVDAILSISGRI